MPEKPVNIAVIADTHVNSLKELPPSVLEAMQRSDVILHLGDFTSPRLLDELKKLGHFHGIWGNHDRLLEMRRRLKRMEVLEIAGKRLGLVHGTFYPVGRQRRLIAWFKKEKIDILLFGHSHVVTAKTLDGVFLFNPGSVTGKFPATHGSFGLLTLNGTIESQVIPLQYQVSGLHRVMLVVPSWIIRQGTAFLESWPYFELSRFWDTFRSLLRLASQNQKKR